MPKKDDEFYTSENLIKFIEHEALVIDLSQIDFSSEREKDIDLKVVQTWYLETEKLIRILANILPSTMTQPINQLRYAGHHVLKAVQKEELSNGDPDLVEAFKHCKRAYYDSLDLYVFHMSDIFRSKINLINISEEISEKIKTHLLQFQQLRLDHDNRIKYYKKLMVTLKEGLQLMEIINQELKRQNIVNDLLQSKELLLRELQILKMNNSKLETNNTILENANAEHISRSESAITNKINFLTIVVVLVTAASILFQGYFTERFITSKVENTIRIEETSAIETSSEDTSFDKETPKTPVESGKPQ